MKGSSLLKYSYQTNEKDVKEASFQSVKALKKMQKKRLFVSFVYPVVMLLYGFITKTNPVVTFVMYILMVCAFYFYLYQLTLFNRMKQAKGKSNKWVEDKTVTLTQNQITVATNGVEQMYDWEKIEQVYETNENIILYLTGKKLDFIIVKKPGNKDISMETAQFFSFFKKYKTKKRNRRKYN